MPIDEAPLRYATSAIRAGVNKRRDAIEKGVDRESAYEQGANQAMGIIRSSGADEGVVIEHLLDQLWLTEAILEESLSEEDYARLVGRD